MLAIQATFLKGTYRALFLTCFCIYICIHTLHSMDYCLQIKLSINQYMQQKALLVLRSICSVRRPTLVYNGKRLIEWGSICSEWKETKLKIPNAHPSQDRFFAYSVQCTILKVFHIYDRSKLCSISKRGTSLLTP